MTKENQEVNANASVVVNNNNNNNNNSTKDKKKAQDQKKLKSRRSKARLNRKKSTDISKDELKLQQEMLRIWKSTYVSLREATEKAKEAKVYTSSIKAIITFVLMKNMFLEVRKEIEQSPVEKLTTNFVIKFVKKARSVGECLDSENNSEDEQTGLILVSLRYHLEPIIMAGAAWRLADGDINRAIRMLCPRLYAMKNRDYEFIGQEAAYLRVFWKGGVKVADAESEKMDKLLEMTNECNESMIAIWQKLYTTVNQSSNPFGVNQFNNMLGGLSLNGYWNMETFIEFIKKEMTLEWLDNRFGDAGRVIGRLWKRLYSSTNNTINREEEKKLEEEKKMEEENSKTTSYFHRRSYSSTTSDSVTNSVSSMVKKSNYRNEFERKREFVNKLAMACSLDTFKKNEISLYLDLPELYGAAAHIVMVDENPVINQFLRYCGPCKKYPIHYAREALKMNEGHMTKTLDMLAWWKEYRNPFIISADKFWELAIETCELDEEILYENYGNIDDFKSLMKELIKNESFRCKEDMEIEEKKFQKVFLTMANGGIERDDEADREDSWEGKRASTASSLASDSETASNSNDDKGSSDDEVNNNTTPAKKSSGGIYRPPSKRGLYGLTHASIINKRQSMNFDKIFKKEASPSTITSTPSAASALATPTTAENLVKDKSLESQGMTAADQFLNSTPSTPVMAASALGESVMAVPLPPSPPVSDFGLETTESAADALAADQF